MQAISSIPNFRTCGAMTARLFFRLPWKEEAIGPAEATEPIYQITSRHTADDKPSSLHATIRRPPDGISLNFILDFF